MQALQKLRCRPGVGRHAETHLLGLYGGACSGAEDAVDFADIMALAVEDRLQLPHLRIGKAGIRIAGIITPGPGKAGQ